MSPNKNEEVEIKTCDNDNGNESGIILEIQQYINHEFLEDILERKISKFHLKAGSNPGDNFTSVLFAVQVWLKDSKEEPLHLLIKTYPTLESRQKFLTETNLFMKEVNVYQEFIPDLVKFQEKMGRSQNDIICLSVPPFIAGKGVDYSKDLQNDGFAPVGQLDNYLVMTDMRKSSGFQMAEKRLGLDFDHTVLAMKELAKLHALGWAYKQHQNLSSLVQKYPYMVEMCFNRSDLAVGDMIRSNFKLIQEILKSKCDENSRIMKGVEKVAKIGPIEIMCAFLTDTGIIDEEKVCQFLDLKDKEGRNAFFTDPWMVTCHGDSWMNNMLFTYDENADVDIQNKNHFKKPKEILFVDLQMYREGCPTTDLAYMLYSSTTYNLRKQELNTLLKIYHEEFLGYCLRLGVEPLKNFTFENLLWRFKRAKIFGFITACLVLPVILSSADEALADLDKKKAKTEETNKDDSGNISGNAPNGDGDEEKSGDSFADLFKSLTESAANNEVLTNRIMGIVNELVDDNIF